MDIKLPDDVTKHIAFANADMVAEICQPLFATFNINYFDYVRIYPDNTGLILISDKNWYENYINKHYLLSGTSVNSGIHLWDNYVPKQIICDATQNFNHHNGITIFTKNQDFIEYFDLAAPDTNHTAVSSYFHKLEVLNQFLFYFKFKTADIINQATTQRFIIPHEMYGEPYIIPSYENLVNTLHTNKIRINFKSHEITLSRREYECMLCLSKGKTIKEVAKILNISPRTVEDYLGSVKSKIGHRVKYASRSALLELFLDNFIL